MWGNFNDVGRVMRGLTYRLCALVAALGALWLPASAGTLLDDLKSDKGVTVTVGAEARITPSWEGSNEYDWMPMPMFDIRPAGTAPRFHSPRDGLNITVFESGRFTAGPTGYVEFARRSSNKHSSALLGVEDVKTAWEIGGFAEYWFYDWLRGHTELRHGVTGHHGTILDLALDVVTPVQTGLTWSFGPRMRISDSSGNSRYFDISPNESIASGLPAYNANGGIRTVGVGTQLIKQWNPQWATHAFVEYDRLVGDAADSPLVQLRGNANQLWFGAGFAYSFDVGGK
jgi:outer membrane protein